jgi:hypothetical protein
VNRRVREVKQLCQREGFEVQRVEHDGRNHYRVYLAIAGRQEWVSFSNTPSDHAGDLNKRAQLRRMARGVKGKQG